MSVFFRSCVTVFIVFFGTTVGYSQSARTTFDIKRPDLAYGSSVDYFIYRNGKRVGEHQMAFTYNNGVLDVAVRSNIVVTVLTVPVFRFTYQAQEQWVDGRLQSVDVEIKENRKVKKVSLKSDGDNQTLIEPDGKQSSARLNLVSNHWNPDVVNGKSLFNTLTGRVNNYRLTELETTPLKVGDIQVNATHYRYSGDLDTEVWYDETGRWVKMRFSADDGSVIEYLLASYFDS